MVGNLLPYTEERFEQWFKFVSETTQKQGTTVQFAIREGNGKLIGHVDFPTISVGKSHWAEIAYWVARPYWGRGICSGAVETICCYGYEHFSLSRIQSHVLVFNSGSIRVLEKCQFQKEGLLRKRFKKEGELMDAFLFARLG